MLQRALGGVVAVTNAPIIANTDSAAALAQFKLAVDTWLSQLNQNDLLEAHRYVLCGYEAPFDENVTLN